MAFSTAIHKIKDDLRLAASGGKWTQAVPEKVQRNLRYFLLDGIFGAGQDGIIGSYITIYLLALGASNGQIGLLTSLASLNATMLLLPGAILSERFKKRKFFVLLGMDGLTRLMYAILFITPFLVRGSIAIFILIAAKVIADGFTNFSNPPWTSLVGDIVPREFRGRYFGSRNLVVAAASMLTTLLAGLWIGSGTSVPHFQIAFGVAVVIGLCSTYFFSRIQEPPLVEAQSKLVEFSFKSLIDTLKSDRNFLNYIVFGIIWNLSIQTAAPFFTVYLKNNLKGTATDVGIFTICGSIATLLASKYFGRLSDRWGPYKLMVITGFLIPLIPFSWIFVSLPIHTMLVNSISGIMWAGFNLAAFNFMLSLAPSHMRARYSAAYQMAVTLATAAGSAIGGMILAHNDFILIFIVSSIGRLLAIIFFTRFVRQRTSH